MDDRAELLSDPAESSVFRGLSGCKPLMRAMIGDRETVPNPKAIGGGEPYWRKGASPNINSASLAP